MTQPDRAHPRLPFPPPRQHGVERQGRGINLVDTALIRLVQDEITYRNWQRPIVRAQQPVSC